MRLPLVIPDRDATQDAWNRKVRDAVNIIRGLFVGINRRHGATAGRPSEDAGTPNPIAYFDTTLGKPVWWNGSDWVDATGAVV